MEIREQMKIEEVNNKTYCMFMEIGNNTGCPWDLTIGEWYWTNNISKMYYCLRDEIAAEAISNYFESESFDEEGEELDSKEKAKQEMVLKKITKRLMRMPKSFEALNNMAMDICEMFKSINVPMNITFVKGFGNCIPLLMAHDAYDLNQTAKEMLENDIFF